VGGDLRGLMSAAPVIVVGFDGLSQGVDALHLAQALAAEDTELVVCCVYPRDVGDHGTTKAADDAERRLRVARELLTDFPRARFSVRPASSPAAGLHEEAEESGAGLLVVGSSHRGPVGRVIPGSVTRQALHAAPCPVAVAPLWLQSADDVSFEEIGVAYDGGAPSKTALKGAARLAREHGGHLRLVSVVEQPGADWASAWVWPPPADGAVRAALEVDARKALERLAADVPGSVEIIDGAPAHELALASARLSLLVVGSRGYGPIRRTLLGTVSGRLAEWAACPIVVVPRAAEGSPVRAHLTVAATL